MNLVRLRTVLCSVHDKTGLEQLARTLAEFGCRLISSGGTAQFLAGLGLPVQAVSDWTGSPEILDGRVKTLHPRVHGGLLAIRGNAEHEKQLQQQGIQPIDAVIVNLYPFVQTVARAGRTIPDVIENIDIGGPAMIRSASKNFESVAVITDPGDYESIGRELRETGGSLSLATRRSLAQKAFELTSQYDRHVNRFFTTLRTSDGGLSEAAPAKDHGHLEVSLEKVSSLRYGENPHQQAGFYRNGAEPASGLAAARILHGKEISYNNLLDLDGAVCLVREFQQPAAVIIKHTNPCGAACAPDPVSAYQRAHAADPVSAFGSVVAFNRTVDEVCAKAMSEHFVECLVAPEFTPGALEILQAKKALRILALPDYTERGVRWRSITGGVLVQDPDIQAEDRQEYRVVTRRQPTDAEWEDLLFAWKVVKHVKSNAIVLAQGGVTRGIGAGQMSRVEAAEIAVRKAGSQSTGSALASDAFFPFRDGIDAAASAGVTAAIQPGGSKRDAEVIAAADEHGMAMIFTGFRHFRH